MLRHFIKISFSFESILLDCYKFRLELVSKQLLVLVLNIKFMRTLINSLSIRINQGPHKFDIQNLSPNR